MVQAKHISTETIERYTARSLSAGETLVVQMHIGECGACRERLASVFARPQNSANSENNFGFSDFDFDAEHLQYEQLESLVDGKADAVEQEIAESHFAVCEPCRRDFNDLQAFRQIAAAPVAAEKTEKTLWQQIFAFDFFGGFVPAFGALAILLTVLFGGWMLIRSNRDEIAQQTNNQNDSQPSPAPSAFSPNISNQNTAANQNSPVISNSNQSDSNAANSNSTNSNAANNNSISPQPNSSPQREETAPPAAPLLAVTDGGKQIELDANGNLRGLENLSPAAQAAIRRSLETGKVNVPNVAKDLASNQTGVLMSGNQSDGVPFALAAPIGKVVREQQPTLSWKPLAGATKYSVAVVDQNFQVVASSGELTANQWTIPKSLPRGVNYTWQVTAVTADGREVVSPASPAPQARFRVLDATSETQISQLETSGTKSHLARGVVFAQAGLLAEARREFQLLLKENPRSAIARKLLANR